MPWQFQKSTLIWLHRHILFTSVCCDLCIQIPQNENRPSGQVRENSGKYLYRWLLRKDIMKSMFYWLFCTKCYKLLINDTKIIFKIFLCLSFTHSNMTGDLLRNVQYIIVTWTNKAKLTDKETLKLVSSRSLHWILGKRGETDVNLYTNVGFREIGTHQNSCWPWTNPNVLPSLGWYKSMSKTCLHSHISIYSQMTLDAHVVNTEQRLVQVGNG